MPGMRVLAYLVCPTCSRTFFGDMPVGHGMYYPALVECKTGTVHTPFGKTFFSRWLEKSFAQRVSQPVPMSVEELKPLRQPLILNCLDCLYGHSLLKLLNTQYYLDQRPDYDVIVLVPQFLRWMVPKGVAAIWTIHLPLRRGSEWNDWLAAKIRQLIIPFDTCQVSVAFSHPHPDDFSIQSFTGIQPFPLDQWHQRMQNPTLTFIWREETGRLWRKPFANGFLQRASLSLERRVPLVHRFWLWYQKHLIIRLATMLRQRYANVDFAIVGLGHPAGFPTWVKDMRTKAITDQIEQEWCKRYAESHTVIGVHGSNMLLPSSLAGTILELMPNERWGNLMQDILPTANDVREGLVRYRFIPMDVPLNTLAQALYSLLDTFDIHMKHYKRPWSSHETLQRNPYLLMRNTKKV
jgi:hypothetical protein